MEFNKYLNTQKKKIEKALDRYLPLSKDYPYIIHKAMRYSVFNGGKRIRPIMAITAFRVCGGKGNIIMPIACGLELIHTYSLVHDDLPAMDNDDLRRGKPSSHKKFNEAIAILTGSALFTEGFRLLGSLNNPKIAKRLVLYISEKIGSKGMVGGQVVDIELDKKLKNKKSFKNNLLRKLEYVNVHKTAALIEASFVSGAIAAGADKKTISNIKKYGSLTGFLFQVVDDILDKDGYFTLLGKNDAINKAKDLLRQADKQADKFKEKGLILKELSNYIFNRISF